MGLAAVLLPIEVGGVPAPENDNEPLSVPTSALVSA
jgi:hypothetical protein